MGNLTKCKNVIAGIFPSIKFLGKDYDSETIQPNLLGADPRNT